MNTFLVTTWCVWNMLADACRKLPSVCGDEEEEGASWSRLLRVVIMVPSSSVLKRPFSGNSIRATRGTVLRSCVLLNRSRRGLPPASVTLLKGGGKRARRGLPGLRQFSRVGYLGFSEGSDSVKPHPPTHPYSVVLIRNF